MSEPFKTSNSKVSKWLQCRALYHYKYVDELQPRRGSRPLQFGRIVHSLVEEDANRRDPGEKLAEIEKKSGQMFRAEREEYGNILEDSWTIFQEYLDYWKTRPDKQLKYIKKKGRLAEHSFELLIDDGNILFKGIIDALAKTPNDLRWLAEHKTFGNLPSEDHRWRNLQSALYIRAMEILGWKTPDGVCWNYVRSKTPTQPEMTQKGEISKRKIVTLPSVVAAFGAEHGLSDAAIAPMLKQAEATRGDYFKRIFVPVKRQVVDMIYQGFIDTSREIAEGHGKKKDMNLGRHCEWCSFEPICSALLTGGDVDYIKEKQFKTESGEEKAARQEERGRPHCAVSKEGARPKKLRSVRSKRDG